MLIGVPTEIKTHEYRVGMTPGAVRELTLRGHRVFVQSGAGRRIGMSDAAYGENGAASGSRVKTVFATAAAIEESVLEADLVIGAVLSPGATAPKLVTEQLVRQMKPGSALVDVAIDQGGCFETSRPTTHAAPTFKVHDVTHYCVANMPGAVAKTSTYALNNATLPFILDLADHGLAEALTNNSHLRNGLNIFEGKITHPAVACAMNASHYTPDRITRA